MVKIKADNGALSVNIGGALGDIITETLAGLHGVYKAMAKQETDKSALDFFRRKIVLAVCDPESPVWDLIGEGFVKCED